MTDLKQRALEAAEKIFQSECLAHNDGPVASQNCISCLAAAMLEFAAKLEGFHVLGRVDETHIPDRCVACLYVRDLRLAARELREEKP